MTSKCCKVHYVYKVFQNVPQLKKILKALKDLTRQLQSRARGNFTPKAKSVGVPGRGRIDHRTAGKRHHILDCDSMRGRLWELCSKPKVSRVPTWAFTNDFGTRPASGPAPQSRAREVRPKSEVGRGAGSWSGSDRQTAGKRYHILDCDSMRGEPWELCSKPKVSQVPTRAFTNDFGTRPASGPAPQSRAREVRPKSKVGRLPGRGRGRIDEPRESGTICGIGIQSGRKGQCILALQVTSCDTYSVRRPECADTSATESARPVCSGSDSAGNAITRFRAGVGPLESY
ncbi:hypothetical protein BKA70DRAFT_1234397 [Coprinopsis sp. MPI-PUGE-AT-0042]|nr:hypothetical protein BKA70DRAFT_1234397 [Coprinopsis sp. MPI-PUGE-AT-0042]